MCSVDVGCSTVLPCRNDDRNVLLACCKHPAVLRVDLVVLLENAAAEKLVDHLPREESLACSLHLVPYVKKVILKAAECLLLRDTCVSDTVHVLLEKLLLLFRSEVSIVWNSVVVVVSHEVHDILFEVVCRARNDLDLVLTDHLSK